MIQDNQKNFSRLQMLFDIIVIAVSYIAAWMIRFIGPLPILRYSHSVFSSICSL